MKASIQNAAQAAPLPRRKAKVSPLVPPELAAALAASSVAQNYFGQLPPSHQKAYADWVGEAKQPATRATRAGKAIARMLQK